MSLIVIWSMICLTVFILPSMDAGLLARLRSRPLKVLLAFTAFKDCISAERMSEVVTARLLRHNPSLTVASFPISDGGDGFLASIEGVLQRGQIPCERLRKVVTGPLGQPVSAEYCLMRTKDTHEPIGIIEIAKISGLEMVPTTQRDVFRTTNHGVGEILRELQAMGVRKVLLGLGGTSTIDAGLSILYALPCFRFEFEDGRRPGCLTGADLAYIRRIEKTDLYKDWENLNITAACDVKNTLLGPEGAVYLFGAQKGLKDSAAAQYEAIMSRLATTAGQLNSLPSLASLPHSGAAGGVLVGLKAAFPLTTAVSGFELLGSLGGLDAALASADVVFTGEGRYDVQSGLGKVVSQIRRRRSDSIVICGQNTTSDSTLIYDLTARYGLAASLHSPVPTLQRLIDDLMQTHTRL